MQRLASTLSNYTNKASLTTCILFVNDGSTDKSLELLKEVCSQHDNFFYLSSAQNHGLSTAIKMGIDSTQSTYLGYIDADLQTNPDDFELLLAHIEAYDMVTGIRANRKDSGFKRLQSKIANGFRRSMTGDTATDTGCPLKVFRSQTAQKLPFFDGMHRFFPAPVIMVGGSFLELPVRHYPRTAGVSKYHLWNRLKGPFMDCFAFRWMKKRYISYQIADNNL